MKILEIIQSLASGGAERLVVDLCNELSKTETVTLLLLKDVDHYYLPQVCNRVEIIRANFPIGFSISQMWRCIDLIKKINPDVVHVHSHARYNLLLANIVLRRRYRFYQTIHSDVYLNYSRGFSGFQVRIAGFLGNCRFITISDTNYKQFGKRYPKLRQRKILNGRAFPTHSNRFNEVYKEMQCYRINGDTRLFIHVARLHPCKNQTLLVQSFNHLIELGENISLIIIGAYFDSEEGKILQSIANKQIHFLGPKTNVYDYLACADAFCLSSDYEGMPMSLIEAMLTGLPLVSTPVSGATDAIIEGKNGVISQSHSMRDYVEAIRLLLENFEAISSYANLYKGTCPYTIATCAEEHIKWFVE